MADLTALHELRDRLDSQNDLCDRLQSLHERGRCDEDLVMRAESTYDALDRAYTAARSAYETQWERDHADSEHGAAYWCGAIVGAGGHS